MKRSSGLIRGATLLAASGLVVLSAAPADAGLYASEATATALTVDVGATTSIGSGSYRATYGDEGLSTGGTKTPMATVLGGQKLISAGTMAQDAVAGKKKGTPYSAACSGLAGDGATLVAVGDSPTCLKGKENVSLEVNNLDFSKLDVISGDVFRGLDASVKAKVKPVQDQLTKAISQALGQGFTLLGDSALHLDLTTLQSSCTSTGTKAHGETTLANVRAALTLPGGKVEKLADLPLHPKPNQKVVPDLGGVTDLVLGGVRTDLRGSLGGALEPLGTTTSTLQTQVLDQVLSILSALLAPVGDNLLDITLNKQTHSGGSLSVTALDIAVAPIAKQLLGAPLAHVALATSTCGSDHGRKAAGAGTQTAGAGAGSGGSDAVPTAGGREQVLSMTKAGSDGQVVPSSIDAGAAGNHQLVSSGVRSAGLWAIVGILALALAVVAAGGATYIRVAARRSS